MSPELQDVGSWVSEVSGSVVVVELLLRMPWLSALDEELVVESTELPLASLTDCSPHPTSKTAARAAIPIIFCEYSIFYHVLRGLSSGA